MQKIKQLLVLHLLVILTYSCKAPLDVTYFQNTIDLEEIKTENNFQPIFKTNDIISISVLATDMDTAMPFNLNQGGSNDNDDSGHLSDYLIDYDGNIEFPVLGTLKIAGLTNIEVKNLIKSKLKQYINTPIVIVRLQNFKITILGEVNNPGTYSVTNDRVTIIEALGLAGDLTIKGKRNNILVIREKDGIKKYHKIDLTSKDIFNTPAYYLTQNDVVYIEPNESQIRRSRTNDNTLGIVFSAVTVVISILTFLAQ